jgi:hypothetical protein
LRPAARWQISPGISAATSKPFLLHFNSPWSNGQVEGHVHRLKLIKRSMYGRANFDLLRSRVVNAT